jgi:hypothetical protein
MRPCLKVVDAAKGPSHAGVDDDPLPSPVPAVGVVCLRGDEVLLIRRGTPPRQGEWSLPGGRIEPGERAVDAALRELREETGVEAEIVGLIDVSTASFPRPAALCPDRLRCPLALRRARRRRRRGRGPVLAGGGDRRPDRLERNPPDHPRSI